MPEQTHLTVNGVERTVSAAPDTPLLYILRNDLKLKGAKFGCGLGQCGSCMVLIDGRAVTACDTPLSAVTGKAVTTIEALGNAQTPNALQRAFIAEQALQCGYCASGMIMTATALLSRNPRPTETDIAQALSRNLCRCGTHVRIVRAIQRAAREAAR
jgi:nicotinate dehydrogenase subunit A